MFFKNQSDKTESCDESSSFELKICNTALPQVENTKFLGIIIDDKLPNYSVDDVLYYYYCLVST